MAKTFLGVMSGTSLDGIDIAQVEYSSDAASLKFIRGKTYAIPEYYRRNISEFVNRGSAMLRQVGSLDNSFGELFADVLKQFCDEFSISSSNLAGIGLPGQTFWHEPGQFSWQIGDANVVKAKLGCPVISDFRRADVARGGQGAPLAPILHALLMNKTDAIVNIGGLANISFWQNNKLCGYDTGPGNALIDLVAKQMFGLDCDKDGAIALSGKVNQQLLNAMLSDPFFSLAAPKSTGKEYFNKAWLDKLKADCSPEDLMATLVELTAQTISDCVPKELNLLVCGGGVHNKALMTSLNALTGGRAKPIHNIDPDFVEAALFAHLAFLRLSEQAVDLRHVTGATEAGLLGAVY